MKSVRLHYNSCRPKEKARPFQNSVALIGWFWSSRKGNPMPDLALYLWITIGKNWEKFEVPMPPHTTYAECYKIAESIAQETVLMSENSMRVEYGCRKTGVPT